MEYVFKNKETDLSNFSTTFSLFWADLCIPSVESYKFIL